MTAVLDKEISFVDLASTYLSYSPDEINTLIKLVERGAEISPHLWEMIVEQESGIKFVNKDGYDFEDFTEAKTGSLTVRKNSKRVYSKGQITNVSGKIGHMRVAIWNELKNSIDFFLIPPNHYCTTYTSPATPRASIQFSYHKKNDTYSNNLELYRVKLLNEVCVKVTNEASYSAA